METAISIIVTPFVLYFIFWMIKEREYVKRHYYAFNNSVNHYHLLFPGNEEEGLSQEEYKAYEILSKIEGESIWVIAIRNSINSGSVEQFRKLIDEIKTEAAPAPQVMVRIIGKPAYDAVMKIMN